MDPEILFPEIHLYGCLPQIHQAIGPPTKSQRRRLRQKMKKLSVGVYGAPPAMEDDGSADYNLLDEVLNPISKRHQKDAVVSAVKIKEVPPSSTQPLQPSLVPVPSSGKVCVLKEGAVQSMAPPLSAHPPLLDCGITQLVQRGSENFTFLCDVSLSACRIEVVVDSSTTKKKRKGSDSSLLVEGRYDLRSRALR